MKALPRTLSSVVVLVAVSAAGCGGRLGQQWEEKFERTYALPPGTTKVLVEVLDGALTVVSGEPGAVRIEAQTLRAADTVEGLAALRALDLEPQPTQPSAGVLALRGPKLPEALDRLSHRLITKAVVMVPPDIEVEAITGYGPVAAVGREAAVRLTTLAGDVRVERCRGDAVVRTGEGVVMVQHHRGGLDVESRDCQTMQIFVDEIGPSGVRLVTVAGGIQAHLPGDAAFALDARTLDGKMLNSFGVPVEPIAGTDDGFTMRGDVAGGGPLVTILAQRGSVSVRARKTP